jgi:hypothetical protein
MKHYWSNYRKKHKKDIDNICLNKTDFFLSERNLKKFMTTIVVTYGHLMALSKLQGKKRRKRQRSHLFKEA